MRDDRESGRGWEDQPLQPDLRERYLRLLGVRVTGPDVEELGRLVRAHLYRVPFENISKLYYRNTIGLRGLPGLERYLDGAECFHFGGTCYANNYYFHLLLADLGYRVRLCGADMAEPDVHLVNMVELAGRDYLVDVGYAAPFDAPLPLDRAADVVIRRGDDRYVLRSRDATGRSRLDLVRDGVRRHGYVAKPAPRDIGEFAPAIADSYRESATFMNAVLLARFFPGRSLVIHNRHVIDTRGTRVHRRTVPDRDELVRAITEWFGMPPEPVRVALEDLELSGDPWS